MPIADQSALKIEVTGMDVFPQRTQRGFGKYITAQSGGDSVDLGGGRSTSLQHIIWPVQSDMWYNRALRGFVLRPFLADANFNDMHIEDFDNASDFTTCRPENRKIHIRTKASNLGTTSCSTHNALPACPMFKVSWIRDVAGADQTYNIAFGGGWSLTWGPKLFHPYVTAPNNTIIYCPQSEIDGQRYTNDIYQEWHFFNVMGDLYIEGGGLTHAWVIPEVGNLPESVVTFTGTGGYGFNIGQYTLPTEGYIETGWIDHQRVYDADTFQGDVLPNWIPDGGSVSISVAEESGTSKRYRITVTGDGFSTPVIQAFRILYPASLAAANPSPVWIPLCDNLEGDNGYGWFVNGSENIPADLNARRTTFYFNHLKKCNGQDMLEALGDLAISGSLACRYSLGIIWDDHTVTWYPRMVGIMKSLTPVSDLAGGAHLERVVFDRSSVFTDLFMSQFCFVGYKVKDALLTIAYLAGIADSDIWISSNISDDLYLTDPGKNYDKKPCFTYEPTDTFLRALQDICKKYNLRFHFDANGILRIFTIGDYPTNVKATYSLADQTDPLYACSKIWAEYDTTGIQNQVVVEGKDANGFPLYSSRCDDASANNPAVENYAGQQFGQYIVDESLKFQEDVDAVAANLYNPMTRNSGIGKYYAEGTWVGFGLFPMDKVILEAPDEPIIGTRAVFTQSVTSRLVWAGIHKFTPIFSAANPFLDTGTPENEPPEGYPYTTGPYLGQVIKTLNGTGAPSPTLGVNDNYYAETESGDIYKKTEGTWTLIGNWKGPQGIAGAPWIIQSGTPSSETGNVGETLLDVSTGDVYQKTESGWGEPIGNIRGPEGKPGPEGSGNVSSAANITDNRIVRGNGGEKGIQETGITVDDSNNISGAHSLDLNNDAAGNYHQLILDDLELTEDGITYRSGFHRLNGGEPVFCMVRSEAQLSCFSAGVTADTYRRIVMTVDGTFYWGAGNAAVDTNLYRGAADTLKTDDAFEAASLTAQTLDLNDDGITDYQQLTLDTLELTDDGITYRSGFHRLVSGEPVYCMVRSDAALSTFSGGVAGDTHRRIVMTVGGDLYWGTGAASRDTHLGRSGVNELTTDGKFIADTLATPHYVLPHADGSNTYVLGTNGAGVVSWVPQLGITAQNANLIFAGPATGGSAMPGFRSQVIADLPDLTGWSARFAKVGIGVAPTYLFETQNPTSAYDEPTLATEFLDADNWTSGGWTGGWAMGWTHTTGNTTALSHDHAAVAGAKYQITYAVTGRTAGTFAITFGGISYGGLTANGSWGPTAATTDALSITPSSTFDGTIVISIKQITAAMSPNSVWRDSNGIIRVSKYVSSSSSNTLIGANAGRYITTGVFNTFFGASAGAQHTTGIYSTAFGASALAASMGGASWNTAIGAYALNALTYATSCTAVGFNTLASVTTGVANTGVGNACGYYITTGSNNSFFGTQAGRNLGDGASHNTTGSNGVFIGNQTRAYADGGTNEIVVGYQAIGAGSNTATWGNTNITDHYMSGRLRLGGSYDVLRVGYARYNFAVDGGGVGTITPAINSTIPDNAVILAVTLNSTTAVTSAGPATIIVGTSAGSSTSALRALTSKTAFTLDAILAGTPTFAVPLKMTAAGQITLTVGAAPLTAGVIEIKVYYTLAEA